MKLLRQPKSRQQGVMLLEALLGILIFSLGILAVVGMQAMAVKTVAESKYRMDAGFLANEVIGDMWVNRSNLASYAYASCNPLPVPPVLANWTAKVESTLPGVSITKMNPPEKPCKNCPTIDIGAGNEVTVTIFWQHAEEANLTPPPPPHAYRVITSINCC